MTIAMKINATPAEIKFNATEPFGVCCAQRRSRRYGRAMRDRSDLSGWVTSQCCHGWRVESRARLRSC